MNTPSQASLAKARTLWGSLFGHVEYRIEKYVDRENVILGLAQALEASAPKPQLELRRGKYEAYSKVLRHVKLGGLSVECLIEFLEEKVKTHEAAFSAHEEG